MVSPAVLNRFGYKKSKLSFRLMQENDVFMVSFFNQQPYLKDKVVGYGEEIAIYGRWDAKRQTLNGMKILSSSSQNEGFFADLSRQ